MMTSVITAIDTVDESRPRRRVTSVHTCFENDSPESVPGMDASSARLTTASSGSS